MRYLVKTVALAAILPAILLMSMHVPAIAYAASHGGTHGGGGGGGHKLVFPLKDLVALVAVCLLSVWVQLAGRRPKDL